MKLAARLSTAALAATFAVASTADAQIQFYTQGFFTSPEATCNQAAPAIGAPVGNVCSGGGFTLTYAPVDYRAGASGPVLTGSTVSLGTFDLRGSGDVEVPDNVVNFTLWIRQVAPTAGSGYSDGYISGSVSTTGAGSFSNLVWRPDEFVNIDATTYALIFDDRGPASGVGYAIPINEVRGINAEVSTVPEPATVLLLVSGLAGTVMAARRRRTPV